MRDTGDSRAERSCEEAAVERYALNVTVISQQFVVTATTLIDSLYTSTIGFQRKCLKS